MRSIGRRERDAILGAMRQVALAGGRPLSRADSASLLAAGRYLLRRDALDVGDLPAVEPADLVVLLDGRELREEALKYLAIMALVDGSLDHAKLRRVLEYARALDVEADYLTDLVEAAWGHLDWAAADMMRKNFDSVISRSSEAVDPARWSGTSRRCGGRGTSHRPDRFGCNRDRFGLCFPEMGHDAR